MMDNITEFDFNSTMSAGQRSEFCSTMCKMASDVITQSQSGHGIDKNYFFYIAAGGLLAISEAIGMTKKIPHGSILEVIMSGLKQMMIKVVGSNSSAPAAAATAAATATEESAKKEAVVQLQLEVAPSSLGLPVVGSAHLGGGDAQDLRRTV